jgi:hypothetical protein
VVVVKYSRREVGEMLRKAGLEGVAEAAMAELPDPVDFDYVQEWGMKRGITRDVLISRMCGGP